MVGCFALIFVLLLILQVLLLLLPSLLLLKLRGCWWRQQLLHQPLHPVEPRDVSSKQTATAVVATSCGLAHLPLLALLGKVATRLGMQRGRAQHDAQAHAADLRELTV